MSETTAGRALRGTKRACQACDIRFYDLARERILCPACGAEQMVEVRAVVASRRASHPLRAAWRSGGLGTLAAAVEAKSEPTPTEEEETPAAGADDHVVLEQEADDDNVSDLVGRELEDPKGN